MKNTFVNDNNALRSATVISKLLCQVEQKCLAFLASNSVFWFPITLRG